MRKVVKAFFIVSVILGFFGAIALASSVIYQNQNNYKDEIGIFFNEHEIIVDISDGEFSLCVDTNAEFTINLNLYSSDDSIIMYSSDVCSSSYFTVTILQVGTCRLYAGANVNGIYITDHCDITVIDSNQ